MARLIDSSGLTGFTVPGGELVASVASNYCTIALKTATGNDPSPTNPLLVAMRTEVSSGASFEGRYITTPLSITLHTKFGVYVNDQPFRIWLLLIDDGGTFRIGAVNCSGTDNASTQYTFFTALDEWALISSTIEGVGDPVLGLGGVIYTNDAAVTSKPFRILGFVTFSAGQPSAGVYTIEPDVVQMFGPSIKKPGEVVQASSFSIYSQSILGAIPWDNTFPQKTEGDDIFGRAIPLASKSPANWFEHDLFLQIGVSGGGAPARVIAAIFQDSGADAIMAGANDFATNGQGQLRLSARTLVGSQTTSFSVRAGMDTAFNATATAALGGNTAGSKFNNRMFSGYTVRELMG